MERASNYHFDRISLRDEHFHRYQLAARSSRGIVVDCACGIGYASDLIIKQPDVKSYLGIDPSEEAIKFAEATYTCERVRFEYGTLEKNSCNQASIDTFLMFETLEHTTNPDLALENVRACLKDDGILLGSVPSAEYEALCEATYGSNPFHLQRFTKEVIAELLGKHFDSVRVFSIEYILGSFFQQVGIESAANAKIIYPNTTVNKLEIAGSFFFIAGSEESVKEAARKIGDHPVYLPSIPKVLLDRDEVEPIRKAAQLMEEMIRERDKTISGQALMLDERWAVMQSMEEMIRERDKTISGQAHLLDERWAVMQSMEEMIHERDKTISGQAHLLDERWAVMQSMEEMIRERDDVIFKQIQLLEKSPSFPEAVSTLVYTVRAYFQTIADRILAKDR
jgi:SAM-dependent methyltransferase